MRRLHPAECDYSLNQKLTEMLRDSMERNKVLPKDPKRNNKFKIWAERNGCKIGPISKRSFTVFRLEGHVGVWIPCQTIEIKRPRSIRKRLVTYKVHVDIPYELADKMLSLGFGP